jgi:uncharacterized protein
MLRIQGIPLYILSLVVISSFTTAGSISDNQHKSIESVRSNHIYKVSRSLLDEDVRILIFSKTAGFRHQSIEPALDALAELGKRHGVHVNTTEDASKFTEQNLSRYNAVVFLHTSGSLFNDEQRTAFKSYIRKGGGFAGIHAAADTEYDWPWYNRLVGAWFNNHPRVQPAVIMIEDTGHLATNHLPTTWERTDEWYNFRETHFDVVNVLLRLDPDSFNGSEHQEFHPIAWYHEFEGGRSFYSGLGHTLESWEEEAFLQHIWGGITYVTGIAF